MGVNTDKWSTLSHNGPIFPPEYEYQKYQIKVKDKTVTLNKEAEEVAVFWAQKHATEYIKDKVCIKNFWTDFKPLLPKELQKSSFPKDWDFSLIVRDIEYKKEVKKNKSKEIKAKEKEISEARKEQYGFAQLNGEKVPLGNYMVEPPGLFMGRGEHPLRFRLKCRTYPEDVTINHSKDIDAPTPPEGHKWKEVIENKNALYVATWKQELTGEYKKVLFSADSIVKQASDQKKFDKAIKLAKQLDYVNSEIDKQLDSKLVQTRKLATVAKLISKLAIRVGDEKGEDTADTFGASSLKVQHINVDRENQTIEFDFLGKDSIRYHNVVEFDKSMIRNMEWLSKDKSPTDELFPGINSTDVNEFFNSIVSGVTAKVFRTAYGSKLLAEELAKEDVSSYSTSGKLKYFTNANIAVAIKLNHQTAVPQTFNESLNKLKDKVKGINAEIKDKKLLMKEELDAIKMRRDERIEIAKSRYTGAKKKESIRRAKDTYDKKLEYWNTKIERLNTRREEVKSKIEIKEKTKGVALGTSLTNYSSPRITYSWCNANNVSVNKIYTPTLQKKFDWATDTSPDYYLKYPNV